MNDIFPTIEGQTGASWSGSALRKEARRATTDGVCSIEGSIDQLITDTVPRSSIDDMKHREQCSTLLQNVMTALEQHFRSRIYNHIVPGLITSETPTAADQVGYWKIKLSIAETQVEGSVVSFEATLEDQNRAHFGDMVGISAVVTVSPDLETITVEPVIQSLVETSEMTPRVPYAGPERNGLRDDREGSSETVLVEHLHQRYEKCTKGILKEIWDLVEQAGDHRDQFEYDHEKITEQLFALGDNLREEIESDPDLGSLITADLSQWALSLDTVPIDDADYELDDQEMSPTDSPPSAFDLIGDMATRRRRFVLKSSGIPLLDGLFPRKIDCILTEELVNQWETSRRSQALSHWSQQVDPVGGSPIP